MTAFKSALGREVAEFLDSMPAAYARAFSAREVGEHAAIVARRGSALAHVETWRGAADRPLVCVVADDQPGLLSFVSDALLSHGLSVKSAQIYCRRCRDGALEAVDFFQLELASAAQRGDAIEPAELASFTQTLNELIAEDRLASRASRERDTIPVPRARPSRFYFDLDALRDGELVLIVETPDFAGLLLSITSALHGQGIRILASDIRTESGFALDRFTLETTGAEPLDAARLCDIEQAVRAAVQTRNHAL
jgi:UTP:GlnB (protein PII) uridylyltransferase